MAKSKKVPKNYIFQWAFKSNKETAGGRRASYAVLLTDTGDLSCDCPSWVFWRNKTKPRTCKHLDYPEVVANSKKYLKMFKQGEALPKLEETSSTDFFVPVTNVKVTKPDPSSIAFGRCIVLDD